MKKNIFLILILIVLIVSPLFIAKNAEFAGTDAEAAAVINQINPDYNPWFKPLWKPQSTEIESLLFALQAALGAGIIGYCLGARYRTKA
jgi:cobalt/nickel transport protein